MAGERSSSDRLDKDDDGLSTREIEQLMMPDTYLGHRHRSRKMPHRKPRTSATWTSESPDYRK